MRCGHLPLSVLVEDLDEALRADLLSILDATLSADYDLMETWSHLIKYVYHSFPGTP